MANIIGIQFQKNGKMYYFDPGTLTPAQGEYVIVDTVRGIDLAEVIMEARALEDDQAAQQLRKVIRIATPQDIQQATDNRIREKEAFGICQRKIAEHRLEMKLVSVEYAFDNSKILFYFTANGRVDFRSLVKDLAAVFKTRIELRQIGVRDEARMLGGLGPCGRSICCGTFLADFEPVSIRMAKEQNLSLNPTKISGVCGRLMCCLKYEQDYYEQTRKQMPRVGRDVTTPDGVGTVTELNILKETVRVRIMNGDSSEIKEYPLENISRDVQRPARNAARREIQDAVPPEAAAEEEALEETVEEAEPVDIATWQESETPEEDAMAEDALSEAGDDEDNLPLPVRVRHGESRETKGAPRRPKPRDKSRLGQPVKRENPKKPRSAAPGNAAQKPKAEPAEPGKPVRRNAAPSDARSREKSAPTAVKAPDWSETAVKSETGNKPEASAPKPTKRNNWAAQLEEAMKSIQQ